VQDLDVVAIVALVDGAAVVHGNSDVAIAQ
jgi:hypothetical protein